MAPEMLQNQGVQDPFPQPHSHSEGSTIYVPSDSLHPRLTHPQRHLEVHPEPQRLPLPVPKEAFIVGLAQHFSPG